MFRTKKDVENHVTCLLSKIDNETERNLRGYTCARLYYQVKDYETANKYLASFLSVRDRHAPSHKLMAEIYEATGNLENALQYYKRSLEIDPHQKEIVLKICELYCQLPVDHETARYWADRAEQVFPHHETVFRLRECLVSAEGEPDRQELENLIARELAVQPKNVDLRIKLLRLYLDTERVKEAYDHVIKIESKRLFPYSTDWYYLLGDVFEAYQEEFNNELDTQFYIHFLTSLDRLISLTVAEPHSLTYENGKKLCSINDAAAVLFSFDHHLKKASEKEVREGSWSYFLQYMKGQLYFHLASLLMKRAKKDQGNWKEACRLSAALFIVGYTFKPLNLLQEIWFSKMEDNQKIFTNFFQQGALRTSFIGHVIMGLCNEDKSKWLQKIKQDVCLPQVRERIYNRLFGSITPKEKLSSSYFAQDNTFVECSLEFPSQTALQEYDKSAYKLCCESLHHLVWLKLHQENLSPSFAIDSNLNEVFKGLQYSNKNLVNGGAESLCILDLEAFLQATVFQAQYVLERKMNMHNARNPHSPLSFPPDITDPLCTKQQANWWYSAYGLYSCAISEKHGEHRRNLQHGLEVIRGVGNHGLEVQLVVHLAHFFADKADHLTKKLPQVDKNKVPSSEVTALETRAIHYWNIALGMLEKLSSGQTLRIPRDQVFVGSEKKLSADEVKSLIEEGKLYLAVCLMNSEKLEEAAEILGKLSLPYASFYLALIMKKAAFKEEKSSNARTALLNKAKNALHETMDRIKDDKEHALNKELYVELEDVECELAKDLNTYNADNSEECEEADGLDDIDSSPAHNSTFASQNVTPSHFATKFTTHSTPRPASTFTMTKSKQQYTPNENRRHIEPSPERLDAQIRALAINQDTLVKTLLQQQRALLDTNKAIVEGLKQNKDVVEQLKKQLEELQISSFKFLPKKLTKKTGLMKGQGDDEDDYEYDANGLLDYYTEESDDFRASGYSYEPPRMVHDAAAAMNYVVSPALPPGPPPPLGHYNYQYPPHSVIPQPPPAAVGDRPYYHPSSGQGLPFSEGQQLPQFHFHVATPVVKPPVITSVSSIPQTLPAQPVMPQPTGQIPVTSPWLKSVGVPHAFQIPLPAPSTLVPTSAAQQPVPDMTSPKIGEQASQSELKGLLRSPVSEGMPFVQTFKPTAAPTANLSSDNPSIFAGLGSSPGVKKLDRSRCDSDIAGSSDAEGHDLEREVMGDFKPLIPLPAEVVVETGEENEQVLFEDRAKLYRFVAQEWKERGIGVVKILYHEGSGRVRLLMRRDQVLKVCANHYITSKMEIHAMKNSDKAWTWVAQDFADEELRPESFCIRFKTSDIAAAFKSAFEKALNIVRKAEEKMAATSKIVTGTSISAPSQQSSFGNKFLPKAGSWSCPTCYISNTVDKSTCIACETTKPGSPAVINVSSPPKLLPSEASKPFVFPPATGNMGQTSFPISKLEQAAVQKPVVSILSSCNSITSSADTVKNMFGGFTFTTSPMIKEIEIAEKDREILVVSTKSKNGPQVTKLNTPKASPFSGFSFKSPPTSSPTSTTVTPSSATAIAKDTTPVSQKTSKSNEVGETIFGSKSIVSGLDFSSISSGASSFLKGTKESPSQFNSGSPLFVTLSKEGRRVSSEGVTEGTPEEFIPTAEFKPVVPLPALVDVKTGEENEDKLFGERAKLFRYDSEAKEWKERGVGELKILYQNKNQKYRILMRRDQVLKLCANHHILPDMKLISLATSDRSWTWFAQDYSEGSLRKEQFAAKFKNADIAKKFFNAFTKCQSDLKSSLEKKEKTLDVEIVTRDPCSGNTAAYSQLFSPVSYPWECSSCHHKNMANQSSCSLCQTYKLDSKVKPAVSKLQSFADMFKPPQGSWECEACYVRNNSSNVQCVSCSTMKAGSHATSEKAVFGSNPLPSSKPTSENTVPTFADLFKSCWECKSCKMKNSADKDKCISCSTSKSGLSPKSNEPSTGGIFGKFQFGSATASGDEKSFPFGTSKASQSEFVFGMRQAPQPSTFSFGMSALKGTSEENGGFKPNLNVNAGSNAPAVFGGSTQVTGIQTKSSSSIPIPAATAASGFVFGSQSSETPVEFRFGSPQKYEFSFSGVRPRSPSKTPKSPRSPATPSDVEEDDDVEPSDVDNIYFQPVIPLPPKVDTKTGEENETVLFCKRAKLFRFADSEWKERGIGDLKILFDESQKKARLLMRRDQVLKVCLNHYLTHEMAFESRTEKSFTWAATDFSEAEASPELFAVRFKNPEFALEFEKALCTAKTLMEGKDIPTKDEKITAVSSTNASSFSFKINPEKSESSNSNFSLASRFGTTPAPSKSFFGNTTPSTLSDTEKNSSNEKTKFSFTSKESQPSSSSFFNLKQFESDSYQSTLSQGPHNVSSKLESQGKENFLTDFGDEVEVVYQALPALEKRALAERLHLPASFYLYEQKEPCKGCRGCTDYIPPYKEVTDEAVEVEIPTSTPISTTKANESLFSVAAAGSFSFADLAVKSGFEGLQSTTAPKNVFAGAGTPLFANLNNSTEGDEDGDKVAQGPDIHFEPVIPLPELVVVKTGEEDEIPIFVNRAKLYRYDTSTKQWKERGVGDFKILQHKEKCCYRIILRRDQVHKIACNHCISESMELKPMSTSDNALCWNAVDYSENQPETSQFAVKFKTKELLAQFRDKFEECKSVLLNNKSEKSALEVSDQQLSVINGDDEAETPVKEETTESDTSYTTLDHSHASHSSLSFPPNADEQAIASEAVEDPEDESEEEDIMFEKRVTFQIYNEKKECFEHVGMGRLRIHYDEDVYGYRITMINDNDEISCDHIIAIQTSLRVENKNATWSAIDLSVEPPRRRQFRASFSSAESILEFSKLFDEGKEAAVHSEIVEIYDNFLQPNHEKKSGSPVN